MRAPGTLSPLPSAAVGPHDLAAASEALMARREPELRRARGVYATPAPLVGYVVRSAHELLKTRFARPAGLADENVRFLDPCAGPMNFLLAAWETALEEAGRVGLAPDQLLRDRLVPHSRGLEILPIPHRLGRLAVRRFLARHGCRPGEGERLPIELADALAGPLAEPPAGETARPPRRPRQPPVRRPVGQPGRLDHRPPPRLPPPRRPGGARLLPRRRPAARRAQPEVAPGRRGQVPAARPVAGRPGRRRPRRPRPQPQRARRADLPRPPGLAPRDLRRVYALDLHGNRRKRESRPDGRPDENVFPGVAQGIAVLLLAKRPGLPRRVLRADLHGRREAKLRALAQGSAATTRWTELRPSSPSYLFVVTEGLRERRYRREVSLRDAFVLGATGLITGADARWTDFDRRAFEARLGRLAGRPAPAPPGRARGPPGPSRSRPSPATPSGRGGSPRSSSAPSTSGR